MDTTIVRAAIHPAIGIARVGNSAEESFLGPEVLDPPPAPPGSYKDAAGALKRQAARFRIYGYNAAGEVVAELTLDKADVEWTVHLANAKAAWYEFQAALDIPEASWAAPSRLRNAAVADRSSLIIDPGPIVITGASAGGPDYWFDTGQILGQAVYLGELRTDADGHLIVLGGRGSSASVNGAAAADFANNDGWYDDVSDGPVTARVSVNGTAIPVDPAWVVVAPPDYAPDLLSVRSMYDLIEGAFIEAGTLPTPDQVSFTRHIYPVLKRLCDLQWVNKGFADLFGWGQANYFLDPDTLGHLASARPEDADLRTQVFSSFRNYDRDGLSADRWPWLYGDAFNEPPVSPRQYSTVSDVQYQLLQRWAAGDFVEDLVLGGGRPQSLEQVPLADQPGTLDRAALTSCLADAFHPGCEMTWPMRHTSMYMEPFRIQHRDAGSAEPSYGPVLTPAAALANDGPLNAQGPGGLSRWLAVPWQTDTASCRAGYEAGYGPPYGPYLATFWPARVPNHVLSDADFSVASDSGSDIATRQSAFARRSNWYRFLTGTYHDQINQMVTAFDRLGVVESRTVDPNDPVLPPVVLVESEVGFAGAAVAANRNLVMLHVPGAQDPATAQTAITQATMAAGGPADQFTAGYINKLRRFPNAPPATR